MHTRTSIRAGSRIPSDTTDKILSIEIPIMTPENRPLALSLCLTMSDSWACAQAASIQPLVYLVALQLIRVNNYASKNKDKNYLYGNVNSVFLPSLLTFAQYAEKVC